MFRPKKSIDIALKKLKEDHIGTVENINVIQSHIKPLALSYALCELHKHNLLTAENRDTLKEYSQPQDITNALLAITSVKLATQENLNTLFTLKNLEFLENAGYLLYRIPENKFSQTVFDKIMELSQQQEPIRQINQYINQLLTKANPINNNSKTHSTLFQSLTPSDSRITNDHSQNNLTR